MVFQKKKKKQKWNPELVASFEMIQFQKGRLHDRAKMARIRQKLERFQQFLQRNREVLSIPCRVHRRLWTRCGTDKSSLFLCKNCWNRSSFCRIRAIFALNGKEKQFANVKHTLGLKKPLLRLLFILCSDSGEN